MKTFKDTTGRTWTITINLGTAMAVRDRLGVDLLQPESGDPPLLTRLGTDELLLGEVICCLLADQFEANKVTESDVRAAFDGKTLQAAQEAFYAELVDFFHGRGRTDRARAVATQQQLIDAAIRTVEAKLAALDVAETIRGATSGGSPEASGSTRDT